MSARETSATCLLLRDVGADVVAVAAAAVDQEGGKAVVMAWPRAMLTLPIAPSMSANLHDDHGFNYFEAWEKVTMLTNGIKMGEYDAAVLSINANTAGLRINFEKAQLRLLEFKYLINDRKRNQRNVSSVEGRGRGCGGRGRGRS